MQPLATCEKNELPGTFPWIKASWLPITVYQGTPRPGERKGRFISSKIPA
jgi:hypothetical protein